MNPKWPAPYRNLAKIAYFKGNTETAVDYLKTGFETTNDTALGLEYAQMQQQAGNIDVAKSVYEEILLKNPGLAVVRNNYAMLLIRGNPDKQTLERAAEMVASFELSENPLFLDTLGWIQFKRNELGKAVKTLERAHDLLKDKQIPEVAYHLAEVYAALERKQEAAKLLETVVASNNRFDGMERAKELQQQLQ